MQGWRHEGIFHVSVTFIVFHRIIEALVTYSMSRSFLAGATADQLRRGRGGWGWGWGVGGGGDGGGGANMSTHYHFTFFFKHGNPKRKYKMKSNF